MLITTGGVLIRTRVAEIREMSRATQGVTLINLGSDEKLAGLQKIVDTDDASEVLEAGAAEVGADAAGIEDGPPEGDQDGFDEQT